MPTLNIICIFTIRKYCPTATLRNSQDTIRKTRAQLSLRWPRNVAHVKFTLSSGCTIVSKI